LVVQHAVVTRSLRKVYRSSVAVEDLSIVVDRGEIFGFLGPNGAGKTTSVKMLTGLVRPTSGSALLLGKPVNDRQSRKRVGFLPELFRFPEWLTGEELLDLHGKLHGMSATQRRRRIPIVLDLVGLAGRAGDRLQTYSKGMQQRAGLAQALLHDPDLVFLDEPTSALDPIGRRQVRDIIVRLRSQGTTVFLNSHLLSEVELVCDRVAVMNRGAIVASGTLDELLGEHSDVELKLGGLSIEASARLEMFGSVTSSDTHQTDLTTVVLSMRNAEDLPRVVEMLVQHGVDVRGVSEARKTLEDLFIELVDDQDRARYGQ
jgi:ABC-2 type transport system ATP-binding protein